MKEIRILGIPALVARTGYTGEDGFELFYPAAAGGMSGIDCWNSVKCLERNHADWGRETRCAWRSVTR